MDGRLFPDGRVVNHDPDCASPACESAFILNWDFPRGSGLDTVKSFREWVIPDLMDVLSKDYVLGCNQLKVGGTTDTASWPCNGLDVYVL